MKNHISTTYSPSYPCKVISSFWNNYTGSDEYDLIKRITLRKEKIDTAKKNTFFKQFQLFQLIHSYSIRSSWDEYIEAFKVVYPGDDLSQLDKLTVKIDVDGDEAFNVIKEIANSFNSYQEEPAFLLFLALENILNIIYKSACVPPRNLIPIINEVKSDNLKVSFIKGYLNSRFLKSACLNLKDAIINAFNQNKESFANLGIQSLCMFGSIAKNEYHDYSDLDLVIDFSPNISSEKIQIIKSQISEFVFNKFHRKSDIFDFNNFKLDKSDTSLEKIF